jgi:hypothetical protein
LASVVFGTMKNVTDSSLGQLVAQPDTKR